MDGADVKYDGLSKAAATPSDAVLDEARFGFARAQPQRSARRTFYFTQLFVFAALIGGVVFAAIKAPSLTFNALYVATFVLFATAIAVRFVAAASLTRLMWRLADQANVPTYTILCPLYREANVVPDLLKSLARLDYPQQALDIKLLVEGDDVDTVTAALALASGPHIEVVIIPPSAPRTKPKALNVGLARARGDYVVVYDAEDRPHPQQLRAALGAFEDSDERLACVQAPLSIDNASASWISQQFAAEYAIQFRELLPLLARTELPLPLGGTSNHFRIDVLRKAGGWDPYNVREKVRAFAA